MMTGLVFGRLVLVHVSLTDGGFGKLKGLLHMGCILDVLLGCIIKHSNDLFRAFTQWVVC